LGEQPGSFKVKSNGLALNVKHPTSFEYEHLLLRAWMFRGQRDKSRVLSSADAHQTVAELFEQLPRVRDQI